jgi:hypothetical protein
MYGNIIVLCGYNKGETIGPVYSLLIISLHIKATDYLVTLNAYNKTDN